MPVRCLSLCLFVRRPSACLSIRCSPPATPRSLRPAIETAILQKGAAVSAEEKDQYRQMLIQTQKQTLTQAVQCDLSFIWVSWVQQVSGCGRRD